jgi:hypothetical protein
VDGALEPPEPKALTQPVDDVQGQQQAAHRDGDFVAPQEGGAEPWEVRGHTRDVDVGALQATVQ